MTVEIWSDVMCPFCYIGKRNYEAALEKFPAAEKVKTTWRSFQLDPEGDYKSGRSMNEYLAIRKGWSLEHAAKLNRQVSDTAAAAGLQFNLEKAVPANSFDAHRLSKLAEEKGLGNELEEKLFEAYFTKGLNIQNAETLAEIAVQAGLSKEESAKLNNPESYAAQVLAEIAEARELGISGVPFFVFNRKYAVSGAQPAEVFLQVLQKLDEEETPAFSMEASGETCSTDGVC